MVSNVYARELTGQGAIVAVCAGAVIDREARLLEVLGVVESALREGVHSDVGATEESPGRKEGWFSCRKASGFLRVKVGGRTGREANWRVFCSLPAAELLWAKG